MKTTITTFLLLIATMVAAQCPATVDHGGQTYNTVQIGDQCWFKQNLNVGEMIPSGQNATNNGTIEKYCYDNLPANCAIYGGLYQWDEAMAYATATATQGICPAGWHIPTQADYQALYEQLGGVAFGYPLPMNGAGKKVKSVAGWKPLNSRFANNESGFSAVGGGIRWHNARFYYKDTDFNMWLSTTAPGGNPQFGGATYCTTNLNFGEFLKVEGLSVRCIKD